MVFNDSGSDLDTAIHYHNVGRIFEAEAAFRSCLEKEPDNITANHLFGGLLLFSGRYLDALRYVSRAVELSGDRLDIKNTQARILQAAGAFDKSEEVLLAILKKEPANLEGIINLGALYFKTGRFTESVSFLSKALRQRADSVAALSYRAHAYVALKDMESAVADFRHISKLEPDLSNNHYNLACSLRELGQWREAQEHFRMALQLGHEHPTSVLSGLSDVLLSSGQFQEGWAAYEARRLDSSWVSASQVARARIRAWNGKPLAGRKLLVCSEQGIGDIVQFARYLIPLAEREDNISFSVAPRHKPLFASFPVQIDIVSNEQDLRHFDCYVPLMSLPHFLQLAEPYWPKSGPYLRPRKEKIAYWKSRLCNTDRIQIAMVWRGSPLSDTTRDIPLEALRPIAQVPGIELISLQHDATDEERRIMQGWGNVRELGPGLDDGESFGDSIAIMSIADLMITSDTGPAHVGGASGNPVWMGLKKNPEWRWATSKVDTPWYPAMRMFRQSEDDAWENVIAEMVVAIGSMRERSALFPCNARSSSDDTRLSGEVA